MRADALKHSIGVKIFGAFLAMSLFIAAVGAYGYYVLGASGQIVADTYDHPMMAINFARAASVDFLEMQNDALRAEHASPSRAAQLGVKIDTLAATLSDDLDVAESRSTAQDERTAISRIRSLVSQWQTIRHNGAMAGRASSLAGLERKILDQFDLLIEFNADHGFVSRREAVSQVGSYAGAVVAVTAMALLIAVLITAFLVRRIVRPLSAAALAADRIAQGEFETPIPESGKDETGTLLNSMRVMQASIRAQVEREKARAQSAEGRLLDAVERSREGVILADGSGAVVVANSELAGFFPEIAEQLVPGRKLDYMLGLIESQCRPVDGVFRSFANRLLVEQHLNFSAGTERQLPDGRWIRISASGTNEGGTILFFSDFSDIKAREESYRIAKQQADAASAAKSRFLANMSHELRTPLNAVIGFSEIISGEYYGPLGDPRYREYSEDVLRSGRNLLSVINSILDLAKTEAGNIELSKQPVDLRTVLRECASMLRKQAEGAGLDISEPEPGEAVFVEADEEKLRQVFLNLISNAIRFTDAQGTVALVLAEDDESVTVEVHDSGIGMTAEEIATALTPFAQVDNRLERRYEGAGLGLPLAKAFTELHGGTLNVTSEKGRGTVVRVHLQKHEIHQMVQAARAVAGRL